MKSLFLSRGMASWMANVNYMRSVGNMSYYQTKREGDKVFMVQQGQNVNRHKLCFVNSY